MTGHMSAFKESIAFIILYLLLLRIMKISNLNNYHYNN
jgi:hypothetical protein